MVMMMAIKKVGLKVVLKEYLRDCQMAEMWVAKSADRWDEQEVA